MTTNYNKVKTEGVEEFVKQFPCIYKTHPESNAKYQYLIEDISHEAVDFLSTYAEKVHKATLEDVLEFVGENYKFAKEADTETHGSYVIRGINGERQRIRDYIKTLTK